MTQRQIGYMTQKQVAAAVAKDLPVLIPMGTLEMQGLHSPMGHDYIVAERLSWAVAERVECLVTPAVNFGYSHFSRPIPGTISLRPETLRNFLIDIAESLLRHDLTRLIFINNHGLNEPILGHVADDIRERFGVGVASVFPSKIAQDLSKDLYEKQAGVFAHGGEPTVSLMMYLTPDHMEMDGAGPKDYSSPFPDFELAGPGIIKFGDSTINLYMDMTEITPTGGGGDGSQASAEKGKIMFERMVTFVADFVAKFGKIEQPS